MATCRSLEGRHMMLPSPLTVCQFRASLNPFQAAMRTSKTVSCLGISQSPLGRAVHATDSTGDVSVVHTTASKTERTTLETTMRTTLETPHCSTSRYALHVAARATACMAMDPVQQNACLTVTTTGSVHIVALVHHSACDTFVRHSARHAGLQVIAPPHLMAVTTASSIPVTAATAMSLCPNVSDTTPMADEHAVLRGRSQDLSLARQISGKQTILQSMSHTESLAVHSLEDIANDEVILTPSHRDAYKPVLSARDIVGTLVAAHTCNSASDRGMGLPSIDASESAREFTTLIAGHAAINKSVFHASDIPVNSTTDAVASTAICDIQCAAACSGHRLASSAAQPQAHASTSDAVGTTAVYTRSPMADVIAAPKPGHPTVNSTVGHASFSSMQRAVALTISPSVRHALFAAQRRSVWKTACPNGKHATASAVRRIGHQTARPTSPQGSYQAEVQICCTG